MGLVALGLYCGFFGMFGLGLKIFFYIPTQTQHKTHTKQINTTPKTYSRSPKIGLVASATCSK